MAYVQRHFAREEAQRLARFGNLSRRGTQAHPWWPEEICEKIDRITWRVYCLGEAGDEYNEFTAYDKHGRVLAVHRVDGY